MVWDIQTLIIDIISCYNYNSGMVESKEYNMRDTFKEDIHMINVMPSDEISVNWNWRQEHSWI